MSAPWGASPKAWDHFDIVLGLTADLLPVVSNPDAKISEASKMKGLGKTPSIYNKAGHVAGLKDWTDRQTTPRQIETWSKESDYGICVQTRELRALDIDVPDLRQAKRILAAFERELANVSLPVRSRPDTGKRLACFTVDGGELRKRSFKVEGGLVEFLASGQQFVAVGTHPSGSKYQWAGGLPKAFPTISLADFERAWAAIVAEFGIEPERRARERAGTGGGDLCSDPTADWLEANWETYGADGEKLFVLCPFKDGHSGDSGETEAAWLLAGTAGYAQGHFACLHASCSGRTDAEFKKAVGFKAAAADDFEDLGPGEPAGLSLADPEAAYMAAAASLAPPAAGSSTKVKKTAPHPEGVPALPLPGFERKNNGDVLATIGNVVAAVADVGACGKRLRFDTFRGELVIASPDAEDWRPFEDADAVQMRMQLARIRFEPVGKELMRDAITLVARDNRFDTAIEWLTKHVPKWDGVERIERFYPDYFKTDDTPYTQACGLYVWTAHAGRVLEPGCQADMATILIGDQGLLKSSGVLAMSPSAEFYGKIDLDLKDADLSRQLRGLLVGELDELKGLAGRQGDSIRAWITKRWEKWTPKYQEYGTTFPRRLLLHGTSNPEEVLADDTGERRWLPMKVRDMVDVDRIVADRAQLWAEGRERYLADGIQWEAAERLAKGEHHKFKATDPWEGTVSRWLDDADTASMSPRLAGVRAEDVLVFCLGIEASRVQKRDEMRITAVLKACGMERIQRRVQGRNIKVWVSANDDLA